MKTETKKLKEQARTLVVNGATLKEASEKTGLSINQVKKYSSNEEWIKEQQEFFYKLSNTMLKKVGEKHIKSRLEAFNNYEKILKEVKTMLGTGNLGDTPTEKIKNFDNILNIINKAIIGESKLLNLVDNETYFKTISELINNKENSNKPLSIDEIEKTLIKARGIKINR
jgi:hypothetical protein